MTPARARGGTEASTVEVARPHVAPAVVAHARFFKVLSDPTRLAILRLLLDGERSVGDLVEVLKVPQSRVSNHLACLRWCRFVEVVRTSRRAIYRIADPRLGEVLAVAENVARDQCEHLNSCSRIGPDWI